MPLELVESSVNQQSEESRMPQTADSTGFDANEIGIRFYYKLELDGQPEQTFEIPHEVVEAEKSFVLDKGKIAGFYKALLYEFGDSIFSHLLDARIHFLWKAKGGVSGGNEIWAKCKKPSGELRYYADADYLIVFSADHCHKRRLKNWQILALLYHELRHTGMDENGSFITVGHEFEGFSDELKLFGVWKNSAASIVKASQELPLFDR